MVLVGVLVSVELQLIKRLVLGYPGGGKVSQPKKVLETFRGHSKSD